MKNLKRAIQQWTSALSQARVITDAQILESTSKATFATFQKIWVILKPLSTIELQAITKIASSNNIPIYPVSGGKNWGLGSKVPQRDGVVDRSLAYEKNTGL